MNWKIIVIILYIPILTKAQHQSNCQYDRVSNFYLDKDGKRYSGVDTIRLIGEKTQNGDIITEGDYDFVIRYFINGELVKENQISDRIGLRHVKWFAENKIVKLNDLNVYGDGSDRMTWYDDKGSTVYVVYKKNEKEFIEQTKDVDHIYYYQYYIDGKLLSKESLSLDEKRDGMCNSYFQNGRIFIKKYYKNDTLIDIEGSDLKGNKLDCGDYNKGKGIVKIWVKNGSDSSLYIQKTCAFVNYKKHGKEIIYDKNGNVLAESTFIEGVVDGYVKVFNEIGGIYSITPYKNGKIDGECMFFNKDGSVSRKKVYKNGIEIK